MFGTRYSRTCQPVSNKTQDLLVPNPCIIEARGVDDRKFDRELFFFKLSFNYFDLGELVELFVVAPVVGFCRRQFGREQGVNESGLSKT